MKKGVWLSTLLLIFVFLAILMVCPALAADGDLDTTFGDGGWTSTTIQMGNKGYCNALQSDGKILVGGFFADSTTQAQSFAIVRYNTDGAVDTTFGTDGVASVSADFYTNGENLAIQTDGKIVIVGHAENENRTTDVIAVARFNSDGSVDTTFGTNGVATTAIGTSAVGRAVAIQSDGKILVAGYALNVTIYMVVIRYNANGSLDTTFDDDGILTTTLDQLGLGAAGYAMVLQSDGKIVVAGASFQSETESHFVVARFETNGDPDTTFGAGTGAALAQFDQVDRAYAVGLRYDGKIIVGGYTQATSQDLKSLALCRYESNGTLDAGFGTNGLTTITEAADLEIRGLAVRSDGKIVTTSYLDDGPNKGLFHIARFTNAGILDPSFGTNGVVNTPDVLYANGNAVLIQTDGKIVMSGYAQPNGALTSRFLAARYEGTQCTFQLSPVSALFETTGGNDEIALTVSTGCEWEVATEANWITITSTANGSGNATITYTVAENTGANARAGTITVAGVNFPVGQAGTDNPTGGGGGGGSSGCFLSSLD